MESSLIRLKNAQERCFYKIHLPRNLIQPGKFNLPLVTKKGLQEITKRTKILSK
ncbi:hypothetical protein EV06_1646 [Prochlorococcus sp. MIT 0602]|nr:hypothetical protein EV06_1646 [Prochlorococcus sp. MIT 0602]KGG15985.1 hypothetical protein EV07_1952 [Prochlorococcus sp. MIT 0603]